MPRFSVTRTRLVFLAFFLVLVIPSIILSSQAYQQLRWQNLHQYQQIALEFIQRVDSSLLKAVAKEEARSDTDYTFFVLAGTPEARFVQRSELSKYPVDSDLDGLIGYFQIDEQGLFSSPILPSAHVQSEVSPSLYGISKQEYQQRLQVEAHIKRILKDNQLAVQPASQSTLLDSDSQSQTNLQAEQQMQALEEMDISSSQQATDRNSGELGNSKQTDSKKDNAFYRAMEKKRQQDKQQVVATGSRLKQKLKLEQTRKARSEKNYSPQKSLIDQLMPTDEQQSQPARIQSEKFSLKLFESELEPFKFSWLESGHFVLYRQVWRNNKRLVQGAVISVEEFIGEHIGVAFGQSSLAKFTRLQVFFGDREVANYFTESSSKRFSQTAQLNGEHLLKQSLSEPFSQVSLDFNVHEMPPAAGANFVILVAGCLIFGLSIGTYFLYRLTLRQSFLVQQQQDFVSSVSHELKTPLTSIRMYGEILKQGWVSDKKKMEYYDYIYSESERLSRLIANVLQVSGVNRNALEVNQEMVRLSELANLIHSKVNTQILQSGFTLKLLMNQESSELNVMLDKDAMIQIVINLVDNAIKYSGKADKKQIDIAFHKESSSSCCLSVRDYGPGISKQHLKKVFDLFYRGGNELTREVTGTGIGLALVKQLATAMGAQISLINRQPGLEIKVKLAIT